MIISKQKPVQMILRMIDQQPVFIVGCSECATICKTGGESEVLAMKELLQKHNITVTGWKILDPACHRLNTKRLLKPHKSALDQSKKILVLACGNGAQTLTTLFNHLEIIPGTDTLFLGEIIHTTEYEKRCNMCGECLLDIFGGICPITRCPKSMLNGPCGGVQDGKCEIDKNLDCVWIQAYELLRFKNKVHRLKRIQPPKDWSKSLEMKRCIKNDNK